MRFRAVFLWFRARVSVYMQMKTNKLQDLKLSSSVFKSKTAPLPINKCRRKQGQRPPQIAKTEEVTSSINRDCARDIFLSINLKRCKTVKNSKLRTCEKCKKKAWIEKWLLLEVSFPRYSAHMHLATHGIALPSS